MIDNVRFHVEDDNVPPNRSPVETFAVKIVPVDDIPPKKHRLAQMQVYVSLKCVPTSSNHTWIYNPFHVLRCFLKTFSSQLLPPSEYYVLDVFIQFHL